MPTVQEAERELQELRREAAAAMVEVAGIVKLATAALDRMARLNERILHAVDNVGKR
jgi:hypothetical protein